MQNSSARAWVVALLAMFILVTTLRAGGWASGTRAPSTATALSEVPDALPTSPSTLELASQYMRLDISYLRWLWWPIILYLFWGMAYVCDEYFVRTIDVISERFQIPDDVAGATLMALGCNGPEMALNTIAIFHPSNIGVGAVIGGEVFNVLVIIGTALLATPAEYLPLQLGPFSFFRDVLFYVASVGLLYWVLRDGSVTRVEAATLLLGALCYTATVALSSRLRGLFSRLRSPRRMARTATRQLTRALSRKSLSRRSLSRALSLAPSLAAGSDAGCDSDPDASDSDAESDVSEPVDPDMVAQWARSRECAEPAEGSVLSVRVDVRNRLMDRGHRAEERYIWLRQDALLVSTAVDPLQSAPQLQRAETGKTLRRDHKWQHGGLVNRPVGLGSDLGIDLGLGGGEANSTPQQASSPALSQAFSATPISQLSRPLLNESPTKRRAAVEAPAHRPEALEVAGFRDSLWEVIPLEDVLYCQAAPGEERNFALHVHQHDSDLGSLITLEFSAQDKAVSGAWVATLCQVLKEQRRQTAAAPEAKSCAGLLLEWVEWLQFPVKFLLRLSIPNMDDPALQHWYPLAFLMSMAWLALFAFSVVTACDGIHADFGISVTVLGFTVAAAGTSFPNVFSGMVVARQGKTSMAVANALGANVQNVFLALAVPWAVQTWFINNGPFALVVGDLLPAVLECLITLVPVVLIYLLYASSLPAWSGGLFLGVYLVYLIIALGQQSSGCATWPFPCTA